MVLWLVEKQRDVQLKADEQDASFGMLLCQPIGKLVLRGGYTGKFFCVGVVTRC